MSIDKNATLSALSAAVEAGDILAARAAIRAYQDKLDNAALAAAEAGNAQDLARWINEGAELFARSSGNPTAGMLAARAGSLACLEVLDGAGFDFEAELHNAAEGTAAAFASQRGHSEALGFFIKRGLAINAKDISPVAVAAQHGQAECLEMLLAAMLGRAEDEAVARAAEGNHVACLKALQRHGFAMDYDKGDGETPLFRAAGTGSVQAIDFLVLHDDNLSPRDVFGVTAVHAAAHAGHTDALEALDRAGADLHEKDHKGMNLAFYAATGGRAEVLTWAVANNVSVIEPGSTGDTPAHCAAKNGQVDCLAVLLDAGVDPGAKDRQGLTVRDTAQKYRQHQVLQLLDAHSAQAAIRATLSAAGPAQQPSV